MASLIKSKIPLIFLAVMCVFWTFFYQSANIFNEYGTYKPEWLLLLDGLIVLPMVCFWCVKDKKAATIKALAYSCLIILLGSFIIPESSKVVWPYFESIRYVAIAVFILLEITTILTVFLAIKGSLSNNKDPDIAISQPIEKLLGKSAISAFLTFEARIWTYALFSKKIKRQSFAGDSHFSSHKKDGT